MDLISSSIGTLDVALAMVTFHVLLVYFAVRGVRSLLVEVSMFRKLTEARAK